MAEPKSWRSSWGVLIAVIVAGVLLASWAFLSWRSRVAEEQRRAPASEAPR